jgi:hypothetical protein
LIFAYDNIFVSTPSHNAEFIGSGRRRWDKEEQGAVSGDGSSAQNMKNAAWPATVGLEMTAG